MYYGPTEPPLQESWALSLVWCECTTALQSHRTKNPGLLAYKGEEARRRGGRGGEGRGGGGAGYSRKTEPHTRGEEQKQSKEMEGPNGDHSWCKDFLCVARR